MQKSLDAFTKKLIVLPIGKVQKVGNCDLCKRKAALYPVVYCGKQLNIHWECLFRIQQGMPLIIDQGGKQ